MRFTTCIRDIYHQVSDDTLSHRAINRIKTVMQGVGINKPLCRVGGSINRYAGWGDQLTAMQGGGINK